MSNRVPTVREKSGKMETFKVREKSRDFQLSQGYLKFWLKSGKSQGILESEVDRDRRNQVLRVKNEKMTKWL